MSVCAITLKWYKFKSILHLQSQLEFPNKKATKLSFLPRFCSSVYRVSSWIPWTKSWGAKGGNPGCSCVPPLTVFCHCCPDHRETCAHRGWKHPPRWGWSQESHCFSPTEQGKARCEAWPTLYHFSRAKVSRYSETYYSDSVSPDWDNLYLITVKAPFHHHHLLQ